jgi:hypothetical protein
VMNVIEDPSSADAMELARTCEALNSQEAQECFRRCPQDVARDIPMRVAEVCSSSEREDNANALPRCIAECAALAPVLGALHDPATATAATYVDACLALDSGEAAACYRSCPPAEQARVVSLEGTVSGLCRMAAAHPDRDDLPAVPDVRSCPRVPSQTHGRNQDEVFKCLFKVGEPNFAACGGGDALPLPIHVCRY